MNSAPAKMLVSVGDKCACIAITGKATIASSVDFKILFEDLWRKGCVYFILDLSDCILMDSTFLGVLAQCGLKINETPRDGIVRTLELYNPSERVSELLESLGVLRLFKVLQGEIGECKDRETTEVASTNATREEITRTCLEAHQLLMKLNPENAKKFKDVTAYLAEELKKPKTGTPLKGAE